MTGLGIRFRGLSEIRDLAADSMWTAELGYTKGRSQLKMLADREKSVDDSIAMLQDTLNALASGNSKDKGVLQYVSRWNEFSIENARQYWKLLV